MFSANENLMLREHKRRVVQYVESTINEEALDMGTTVMVMQTACRTPGCVPLETAIAIVFPRLKGIHANKEWVEGLKESCGGTYKTKILLPLSEVTRDDVLDALPPQFEGGRKTWERTCLHVRDLVLGRIGGLVGDGDSEVEVEERRILAEYLRQSLGDYLERECKAPELNMPFEKLSIHQQQDDEEEKEVEGEENDDDDGDDKDDREGVLGENKMQESSTSPDNLKVSSAVGGTITPPAANVVSGTMQGNKNFTIRRPMDDEDGKGTSIRMETTMADHSPKRMQNKGTNRNDTTSTLTPILNSSQRNAAHDSHSKISNFNPNNTNTLTNTTIRTESAMDWRRRNDMTQNLQLPVESSSDGMIQRLSQREHAPGIRRPGCPCCEPDQYEFMMQNL